MCAIAGHKNEVVMTPPSIKILTKFKTIAGHLPLK